MAHLESSKLFSVQGLVAVITGGGSGKDGSFSFSLQLLHGCCLVLLDANQGNYNFLKFPWEIFLAISVLLVHSRDRKSLKDLKI